MDKQHIKSQSSIEFLLLSGVLLFMLVVSMGIVSNNAGEIIKKGDMLSGEDIVTKIQKEINLAARVVNGYSREFTLPQQAGSKNYTILIVGNEVAVRTNKEDFWRVIPPVVGNLAKGRNTINKTNDTIHLN